MNKAICLIWGKFGLWSGAGVRTEEHDGLSIRVHFVVGNDGFVSDVWLFDKDEFSYPCTPVSIMLVLSNINYQTTKIALNSILLVLTKFLNEVLWKLSIDVMKIKIVQDTKSCDGIRFR